MKKKLNFKDSLKSICEGLSTSAKTLSYKDVYEIYRDVHW